MPSIAWILIVGFGAVIIELGIRTQGIDGYLSGISKDLHRIAEQLEGVEQIKDELRWIEKIKDELEWTTTGSFAEDLRKWLESIERSINGVERAVERS
jgi:hypothetical protein